MPKCLGLLMDYLYGTAEVPTAPSRITHGQVVLEPTALQLGQMVCLLCVCACAVVCRDMGGVGLDGTRRLGIRQALWLPRGNVGQGSAACWVVGHRHRHMRVWQIDTEHAPSADDQAQSGMTHTLASETCVCCSASVWNLAVALPDRRVHLFWS
mmetsp:Transcript_2921/g.8142  ORF Transcript_2921/g.8142 Transcript_2921/m.8142 type:complete len:154 (+) Transcript_2921:1107-1568(+)